jgi:hypothetical protein
MKTITIIKISICLLFLTAFSYVSNGSPLEDFTKTSKKEFKIEKGAKLKINAAFTDIKAYNWGKDIISIEVSVNLDAKNESKAEERFNRLIIEMQGSSELVSLTTGLKKGFNNNGNTKLDIEAIIYYPSHIKLDLENEFGSCFFEDVDGSAEIKIVYGDLNAQNLNNNDLDLDVEFGNVHLQKFQAGKVEIAYGGLETQYVGMLQLKSEFSSVDIEEINQIELETAYDKIFIGTCNSAFVEAEFSTIRIDKISKSLELDTEYGSFHLKSIHPEFDLIKIDSEFAGINLLFEEPLNFAFKADIDMGDFKYPEDLAKITFYEKEMLEMSIKGYFGNADNQEAKVELNLKNASASIKSIK